MTRARFRATERGKARHIEGTAKAVFTWRCGHQRTEDFSKKPPAKRLGPVALKFLCRYWAGSDGVILGPCPTCEQKEKT